MIKTGGEKV